MTGPDRTGGWDPGQYERFAAERAQPFRDLLQLVRPVPGGRVVDLGCGTGQLTAELHEHCGATETVGIDNSEEMLERAREHEGPGLSFHLGDIATWRAAKPVDAIVANASLQWVPGHPELLARLSEQLAPGGQLAVQVPANLDHPSHTVLATVAAEDPFDTAMGGRPPPDVVLGVLAPDRYASLLHELGFAEQHVRLQVYGHLLAGVDDVVEWTKGTSMVRFRNALPPELFEELTVRYRERLREVLGTTSPYFYTFKRILFWARRP